MKKIIYNGKIRTGLKEYEEAMVIENGLIGELGPNEEILKLKTDDSELIDLGGRLVLPGFNDSHMHFLNNGFYFSQVNLTETKNIDEALALYKRFINENESNGIKWIVGFGWNEDNWDDNRILTKDDLDSVTTEYPVIAIRACVHVCVLNSKALELIGIRKGTEQPETGSIALNEDGEPTGVLYEMLAYIYKKMDTYTVDEIKKMLVLVSEAAAATGITSVQTDDFESIPGRCRDNIIKAYEELSEEGKLKVRVYEQCRIMNLDEYDDFKKQGYYSGRGDSFFRLGPLKTFCDGSLGGRTAWMKESYSDQDTCGIPIYKDEELEALVERSHKDHMAVAVHAIGDAAVEQISSIIKKVQNKFPEIKNRHGIVHSQIMSESSIDCESSEDIIAYIQPVFIKYDMHMAESRVGCKRLKHSYNYREMYDKGIHIPFGTDSPVESFNPLNNIYCAVTRKDFGGFPEKGWDIEKALTLDESIKCYSEYPAFASYEENLKGKIETGFYADLVVLNEDIFNIEPENIKDVKVWMTIMNGDITYTMRDAD